jgi:hypothetical protein
MMAWGTEDVLCSVVEMYAWGEGWMRCICRNIVGYWVIIKVNLPADLTWSGLLS